ncbi:MAG: hypothetical protein ACYCXA_01640 [Actinomycetes bacterium]
MTSDAVTTLADGLGRRVRDVAGAMRRYDGFVGEEGVGARVVPENPGTPGVALDAVLRALRVGADPQAYRILGMLVAADTTTGALAATLGTERLAVWRQVGELATAGLVVHVPVGDRVGASAAGRALVELVDHLVGGVRVAAGAGTGPRTGAVHR